MLDVDVALARVLECALPLAAESVPLMASLGRVLAVDVSSPEDLPPFDNSAMDGFALPLGGAGAAADSEFEVLGEQAAGDAAQDLQVACEIMTGARLPAGLDAVVPVEQTAVLSRSVDGRPLRIRVGSPVRPGQHVRRSGEDIARGELVLSAGSRIGPTQLMLLAGLGVAQLSLRPQPRVALFCTGRELVDDPAQPLASGQIRNNNAPYLRARIVAAGAELIAYRTVPDDVTVFVGELRSALAAGAQVLISTGAVSMGRYDFVPDALRELGAQIVFHKVRMRPGKPILFARLPSGQLYFGLPGNPASSAVGLRFFVEPLLRVLMGLPQEKPLLLPLAEAARKAAGFKMFQKARVEIHADARLQVRLLAGQESFKVRPLTQANAWAALPEDVEALPAGSLVEVYAPDHWGWPWATAENA